MAKQSKKARPTKRGGKITTPPAPPPSQEEFKRADDLLHQRAEALVLDLAKRYQAGKAAELTTVLNAIDSLFEIERQQRPAVGAVAPRQGLEPVSQSTEGGTNPPADREDAGPAMATGTVKWFNPQKGFGFIVHTATRKDVFVHISAVEKAGLTKLNEGQQIEFELDKSRGKVAAVNLRLK